MARQHTGQPENEPELKRPEDALRDLEPDTNEATDVTCGIEGRKQR